MSALQNSSYQPYNQYPQQAQPETTNKPKKNRFGVVRLLGSTQFLLVVILVMFGAIVYLMFNPPFIKQTEADKVASKVAGMTTVNESESPLVATVSDVEKLRSENQFQQEVYKDAQNGDYIVAYSDKMIIYRKSENKIVYEGETPQQKVNKFQEELANMIRTKANAASLDVFEDDVPQINVVEDVAKIRQSVQNGFYDSAAKGDYIAVFPQSQVIILYRQSEERIINSGKLKTDIQ